MSRVEITETVTVKLGSYLAPINGARVQVNVRVVSTATLTSGSSILTLVTPTARWEDGMTISGVGIPVGTTILSGAGTATMVMSVNATASGAGVSITGSGPATVYAAQTGAATVPNPVVTVNGRIEGYVPAGSYDFVVSGTLAQTGISPAGITGYTQPLEVIDSDIVARVDAVRTDLDAVARPGTTERAASFTMSAADNGRSQRLTVSALTVTVPAAATLQAGFRCEVWNAAAGASTIDGPGATNVALVSGDVATIMESAGVLLVAVGPATVIS